jgi:hypothetical protein
MPRRALLLFFFLGLIPPSVLAVFQPTPGYIDAAYYFGGGIQLATGRGFTEPYLWNYLDGAKSLPHPSHAYWMPLASMVSAFGMWLAGDVSYAAARLPFIMIAALAAPVTAELAYTFTKRRDLAAASALLAVFSIFHAPFVGVTDNYGLYMLFGGLYFLAAAKLMEDSARGKFWFALGVLAGLLSLSRSDGLLWLGMTLLFALFLERQSSHVENYSVAKFLSIAGRRASISLLGFLLVMFPWYARNVAVFGAPMAPSGGRALWLQNYSQTFIYPPELLTLESFLAHGWGNILADRLHALGVNLLAAWTAHGGIVLFPFIVAGVIYFRRDDRVRLAAIGWLVLFAVMTVLFPFAGPRGAFFHAGAAFQPMWWSLAPPGLDALSYALAKKRGVGSQLKSMLRSALVLSAILLTLYVSHLRLFTLGWGEGEAEYPAVERYLLDSGIAANVPVIVRNPPGYYISTGRPAVVIPHGGAQAILLVAEQFDAEYLILEPEAVTPEMKHLLEPPGRNPHFLYSGEVNDIRIYRIVP